jgi:catechol 2,3-dioxygenase-like lactoylglutathione lyase family enzyme
MPASVPQPSHLGLCVSDLDRSLRFYCDGLGFSRGGGFDLESTPANGLDRALEVDGPAQLRSQWISHGALQIELLAFAQPSSAGTPSAHRNHRASRTWRSRSTTSTPRRRASSSTAGRGSTGRGRTQASSSSSSPTPTACASS